MAGRIEEQMEQLRKSDASRRELIANVSHDLRTPLATLQGYIETVLIKENVLTREERRQYLEIAIRHCTRLSKLVSELLELAKLDSYEVRVKREPFNLSELLQDVVQKFQLKAGEKRIQMETNVQATLPFVNADIGLIERVLENLLENALDYTPQGGSVSLSLTPEGENILVKVSDTGCGIPEEQIPHIFDRSYQLERRRSGQEGHSGLGLAIAKKILDLHERSITATSSPGSGTSFFFYLPSIDPAQVLPTDSL
jgi:signal transduction histidine kinase